MNWDLMVKGPEERDLEFSQKMALDFLTLTKVFGTGDSFILAITEKYEDEEIPHYSMRAALLVDDCQNENYAELRARYEAGTNGESHNGVVNVRVYTRKPDETNVILAGGAFALYNKAIGDYYPEWTTDYIGQEEIDTGKV